MGQGQWVVSVVRAVVQVAAAEAQPQVVVALVVGGVGVKIQGMVMEAGTVVARVVVTMVLARVGWAG